MIESARGQSHPRKLGRVSHQCLQEQRQQQCAPEQREAQHEHQQVRDGEGAIAEQMEIDDRILVPPLPPDHEQQRRRRKNCEYQDEV